MRRSVALFLNRKFSKIMELSQNLRIMMDKINKLDYWKQIVKIVIVCTDARTFYVWSVIQSLLYGGYD